MLRSKSHARDENDLARKRHEDAWAKVRRSYHVFLKLPILVVGALLLLAVVTNFLDRVSWHWLVAVRTALGNYAFGNPGGTRDVLAAIASGIITMTSITASVLLVAVQQSSTNLTPVVFDQFLRRKQNQVYFGFFVGSAIYTLITLATVDRPFVPVLAGTGTILLTLAALSMLVVLLYSTIDEMRPVNIIERIHDHILSARARQLDWVTGTRSRPRLARTGAVAVAAPRNGHFVAIDVRQIARILRDLELESAEVVLCGAIGAYFAVGESIAELRLPRPEMADRGKQAAARIVTALRIEADRDLAMDPAYGLEQLRTIAWTTVSSAKHNLEPGLLCVRSLHDVLARWAAEAPSQHRDAGSAIVYPDDVVETLFDALEAIAAVSSESTEDSSLAEILSTLARVFPRLPEPLQLRAQETALRIVPAFSSHVLTRRLESAILQLSEVLVRCGADDVADAVRRGGLRETRSVAGCERELSHQP